MISNVPLTYPPNVWTGGRPLSFGEQLGKNEAVLLGCLSKEALALQCRPVSDLVLRITCCTGKLLNLSESITSFMLLSW